jgi:DNA primase
VLTNSVPQWLRTLADVAGRIRDEDIAEVRDRARIEEVVSQYVTLRRSGAAEKGLCPFHDEKTPSFQVRPSIGSYHCFGCGAGGDVFRFVMEVEGMPFVEAVERLADKYGVHLRRDETESVPHDPNRRSRLVEANAAAAQFYVEQLLTSPDAVVGRQFLDERGFGKEAAERFTVGFAPRTGEALLAHLRGRGFKDAEIVAAGLAASNSRGAYDRFRGRLLWPIRNLPGEIVGFGARRLFDDDRIEAKYLNTPETALYKKSQVLYGVEKARRAIATGMQAVVVEGYTDVMACHEAGVETAVATCGTAFGEEHTKILRRLLADHDEFRGEVIFTFDGDEAGQRAAMKAFAGDQQFVAQTYVAVDPDGRDPCDIRMAAGDEGVRELVARRVPLYRFVLRNVVERYDLDRADQRVNALREAARLVASVRDKSKVDAFARELAGMVGLEVDEVRSEVRKVASRPVGAPADAPSRERRVADVREPRFADEREAMKAVLQLPHLAAEAIGDIDEHDFTHPWLTALVAEPLPQVPDPSWVSVVAERAGEQGARSAATALAVEPMRFRDAPDARDVAALLARLQELTIMRRIEQLKSRLQRTNPVEQLEDYNKLFGQLVALEQQRRTLRERALGAVL